MDNKKILEIFKKSHSKSDVARELGWQTNGYGIRKVNKLIKDYLINISHFDYKYHQKRNRIYNLIIKKCPVCTNSFETLENHKKEKTTCSKACSNTYFRSGENNPNFKIDGGRADLKYRKICFKHHKKECVVCGENIIVEVHHYDGDHENNKPENLTPLCPTHHKYWHSRHRIIIKEKIDNYVKSFIKHMG